MNERIGAKKGKTRCSHTLVNFSSSLALYSYALHSNLFLSIISESVHKLRILISKVEQFSITQVVIDCSIDSFFCCLSLEKQSVVSTSLL